MQTLHVEACGVLLGAHLPFTGRDLLLEEKPGVGPVRTLAPAEARAGR